MKVRSQAAHKKYNTTHCPGTRQMCIKCDASTGFCEEDALYTDDGRGPLCRICYNEIEEADINNAQFKHYRR